jgi:hypothetical protein
MLCSIKSLSVSWEPVSLVLYPLRHKVARPSFESQLGEVDYSLEDRVNLARWWWQKNENLRIYPKILA